GIAAGGIAQGDEFLLDGVECGFGYFEQHQAVRPQFKDLAAQFRTDRAARAGYHDGTARDAAPQQLGNGRNGVAAQQVFDLDVAQPWPAAWIDKFAQAGYRANAQPEGLGHFDHLPDARARGRRHGNQQLRDLVFGNQPRQLRWRVDAQARHDQAVFARIVVDHGHRQVVRAG